MLATGMNHVHLPSTAAARHIKCREIRGRKCIDQNENSKAHALRITLRRVKQVW